MGASGEDAATATAGLDEGRVGAWLAERLPGLRPPLSYELIAGGRSNLTYKVVDAAGAEFVLRRPPLGNILASAHDMGREYRILDALYGSVVPVPEPLALCEDTNVNGPAFYAMSFVDGWVVRDAEVAERAFPEPADRRRLGASLIEVMAKMHLLDPAAVGLGELGRHHGYVERQLRRWYRQWNESKTRELAAIDSVHERLSRAIPAQQRVSIVHGDYRLDNVVSGRDARVAAVLDWELCTLGDPLADLGNLLITWVEPGESGAHSLVGTPTALSGFPTRHELIETYGRQTGLDVGMVSFYLAFAYWRLACIGEGVYARYRAGAMGEDSSVSISDLRDRVDRLAVLADATCPV